MYRGKYSRVQAPVLPHWAENAVIYEVNVRQFTPQGTFAALAAHLPRLKELGVTVLWFMPIHPIGRKRRKGSLGSYYAIRDYYDINPEFGTLDDFKKLVKKIHDLGMFVIIDLVANHTAWDHPLIEEHPEWYRRDEDGTIVSPLPGWQDVAALNYENPDVRQYMSDMMVYWVQEIGIDGYRCDVAELVPPEFWQTAIARLQKKSVLMLAEGQHPSLHAHGFHLSYAFNMYWLFNGIVDGTRRIREIDELLAIDISRFPTGARRLRFTSNHDQNSWLGSAVERLGQAARVFAVLTFTLPGTPLIYSGQETGNSKRLEFYEKDVIEWQESPFTPFYQRLCDLYKNHPALYKGEMTPLTIHDPDALYAFERTCANDRVVVVANLSSKTMTGHLVLENIPYKLVDAFTGDKFILEKISVTLAPWDFRIYTVENSSE
ncbi:alpha-amylase [candidate division KSB1 bacterium]|nr:alpha-glucosidase C-terminal domain-containing protein [candidate division KSB1 bacterium]RQW01318.1 MAG: alpha-amylase [candidate division KSB1 bacterium]